MNMSIKLSAVLFAVLLISSAFAGPRELTYQGQLYESGSAVDATKYFQFELIKDSVVVWKSYGTGTGRVALNVSKGFFSVPLGDTTIANMEALPAGMFDDDVAVYLKVYVGDATGDMTALSPNSKITSAAYVMNNQTQKIVLTNWAAIYGGATNVIVMTGAPLLTTPVWDDIRVPLDVANSSLYPGYKQLGTSGLYLYDFDKTKTESLNFTCQIRIRISKARRCARISIGPPSMLAVVMLFGGLSIRLSGLVNNIQAQPAQRFSVQTQFQQQPTPTPSTSCRSFREPASRNPPS